MGCRLSSLVTATAEASHCLQHPRTATDSRSRVSYEAPRGWEEWWPPPPSADVDPGDAAEHFVRRMVGEERWGDATREKS